MDSLPLGILNPVCMPSGMHLANTSIECNIEIGGELHDIYFSYKLTDL